MDIIGSFYAVVNDAGRPAIGMLWQPGGLSKKLTSELMRAACPLFIEQREAQSYCDELNELNPSYPIGNPECGSQPGRTPGSNFVVVEVTMMQKGSTDER